MCLCVCVCDPIYVHAPFNHRRCSNDKETLFLILFALFATACSKPDAESRPESTGSSSNAGFPSLPTTDAERVLIEGKMIGWFFEGDGGCFGTLKNGAQEVEVWAEADACEQKEYKENEPAAIVVTYRRSEQWAEKSYSIVEFREPK